VHLFDVDYTLIRRSTAYYFLLECLKQRVIRLRHIAGLPLDLVRYQFGLIRGDFIENAVKHLAGLDRKALEKAAADCFETRVRPQIYEEAQALVTRLLAEGETVVLATSTFETLLIPLESYLGVTEPAICSRLEFAQGKTTGRVEGPVPFGPGKLTAVRLWCETHGVPPADITFYSDSYTDIPVLEYVGHPVAVNPDRFLRREARRQGWPVLRFR
jgi:HAD superfamily hydrolase (TIGR01490 family)